MSTHHSLFGLACRAAAFSFLVAGTATLLPAQQASSVAPTPLFVASAYANPFASLASSSSSSSSSDSDSAVASDDSSASAARLGFGSALGSSQPPPRRRYGNPNYADSHSNPDGSPKWVGIVGGGFNLPIGDTHFYETTGWNIQAGAGRNFNKTVGVLAQFDYNDFGLQGATVANEQYIYNYCTNAEAAAEECTAGPAPAGAVTPVSGNNHVWSFTVDPTFTVPTEGSLGAYAVLGAGFYHKVTNFTTPETQEACYYICEEVESNATFDHYTSNAVGFNGGLGVTWKFSKFASEKFYAEARYVFVDNSPRTGVTTANVATSSATATDFYPANSHRTTYIPVTFGLRF